MKCLLGQTTEIAADGRGESCTLVLNQHPSDAGGWLIEVYASFSGAVSALVRSITVTTATATGSGSRVAAICTIPGAESYSARVRAVPGCTYPIDVTVIVSRTPATMPATVVP
jgi:hypothetical protein